MFSGFIQLGGEEIANAARTRAYVKNNLPTFPLKSTENLGELTAVLGHAPYTSPAADNAPWYEPRRPETARFYGFYPLSIEGADSSTRTAAVLEGIHNGGTVAQSRHTTRQIRVRGVLIAKDQLALTAGAAWLAGALEAQNCSDNLTGSCGGAWLGLFAAPPAVGIWPTQSNERPGWAYERNFVDVVCVEGPTVIKDYHLTNGDLDCGGAMREVDFLLVAGTPFCYGPTSTLSTLYSKNLFGNLSSPWDDNVLSCPAPPKTVILDPSCPVVPPPPRPPVIPNPCVQNPTGWWRLTKVIDKSYVADWHPTVASIEIVNIGQADIGQMRVRFYPNPFNYTAVDLDPCGWCAEFILGYLPATKALTLDGVARQAWIGSAGDPVKVSASNLLFGTGGIPMSWPELSNGMGYIMTVDMVDTEGVANFGAPPGVEVVVSLTDRM